MEVDLLFVYHRRIISCLLYSLSVSKYFIARSILHPGLGLPKGNLRARNPRAQSLKAPKDHWKQRLQIQIRHRPHAQPSPKSRLHPADKDVLPLTHRRLTRTIHLHHQLLPNHPLRHSWDRLRDRLQLLFGSWRPRLSGSNRRPDHRRNHRGLVLR